MTEQKFDASKAYAAQEDVFFDDGREAELLDFVYGKPNLSEIRGSPQRVLAAIDEFGQKKKYLMNVGEIKGKIVTDMIRDVKPKTMVELGGYVGYSCILFASAMTTASPGETTRYFTLERSPEFARVITSLVDLAGLSSVVKVIVGSSDESIKQLHTSGTLLDGEGSGRGIDMLFLDHYKPAYTTDLKLCEELGLIHAGTVLCADNVISPGNPPYLEYVRSTVQQKREGVTKAQAQSTGSSINANGHIGVDERFAARSANQYKKSVQAEKLDTQRIGNPNLVYKSKLVDSWEPTGVPDGIEVTTCMGVEAS